MPNSMVKRGRPCKPQKPEVVDEIDQPIDLPIVEPEPLPEIVPEVNVEKPMKPLKPKKEKKVKKTMEKLNGDCEKVWLSRKVIDLTQPGRTEKIRLTIEFQT